jgi:hypothetical protein
MGQDLEFIRQKNAMRQRRSRKAESGNPPPPRLRATRAETGRGFKRKGAKRSLKFQNPKLKIQGESKVAGAFASEIRRRQGFHLRPAGRAAHISRTPSRGSGNYGAGRTKAKDESPGSGSMAAGGTDGSGGRAAARFFPST